MRIVLAEHEYERAAAISFLPFINSFIGGAITGGIRWVVGMIQIGLAIIGALLPFPRRHSIHPQTLIFDPFCQFLESRSVTAVKHTQNL